MDRETIVKHAIFGAGVVALVAAAALAGSSEGSSNRSYTISIGDDDYERASKDRVAQDRDVATFTKILVKGGIELDLKAGGDQRVTIEAAENRIDFVETTVDGDTLTINLDHNGHKRFWNNTDVDVVISLATFEGIEILGAVDGDLTNIASDALEIDIKGAANLNVSGICGKLTLDLSGAGDIDADRLQCKDVDVDLKGAGAASVYASDSVDALMAGAGSISVYGDPKNVNKRVGGIGTIRIR